MSQSAIEEVCLTGSVGLCKEEEKVEASEVNREVRVLVLVVTREEELEREGRRMRGLDGLIGVSVPEVSEREVCVLACVS